MLATRVTNTEHRGPSAVGRCGPAHGERHRGSSARYSDQTWRFSMVTDAFNSSIWEVEAGRVLWQFQASQSWEKKPDKWEDKINEFFSVDYRHLHAAQRSHSPVDHEDGHAVMMGMLPCSPNCTYHSLCSPCPG